MRIKLNDDISSLWVISSEHTKIHFFKIKSWNLIYLQDFLFFDRAPHLYSMSKSVDIRISSTRLVDLNHKQKQQHWTNKNIEDRRKRSCVHINQLIFKWFIYHCRWTYICSIEKVIWASDIFYKHPAWQSSFHVYLCNKFLVHDDKL